MDESVCVFVVDDDALVLLTVEQALQDGGFDCRTATSADEAMSLFQEHGDECRALITDVNLGAKLNGWDVARGAREQFPTLPVVYVTGDSAQEWNAQGVPNSVLLNKPFVAAQIVNAVATLLNNEAALPPG
jgi:DNA-binding response OmpR family regulator